MRGGVRSCDDRWSKCHVMRCVVRSCDEGGVNVM